jgi:4'-phosphopantetheinyl transferase EntD
MALLIKEKVDCGTLLGVWRIEEDMDLLLEVYPIRPSEFDSFNCITNPSRKKEWLLSRILLTELAEKQIEVIYNQNGKPSLKNSDVKISISHSRQSIACLYSTKFEVGVDIEQINHRPEKVRHKYLTVNEQSWCNNQLDHTLVWSAKESVFKLYEKELDFQYIEINPPSKPLEHGLLDVTVNNLGTIKKFICNYRQLGDQMLTFVIQKD